MLGARVRPGLRSPSLLAALGGAVTGTGRAQRAADLAALSAARSHARRLPRLLLPPARLPDGAPNPPHLSKGAYLARASAAARGGRAQRRQRRVVARSRSRTAARSRRSRAQGAACRAECRARAERLERPRAAAIAAGGRGVRAAGPPRRRQAAPAMATGGGYSGPLRTGRASRCGPTSPPPSTGWPPPRPARRPRARRQLRLPLRRRAGGALRRPPGPALGRAAGPVAAPLRDRARPRARGRLRLAGRQRAPLRLRAALRLGAVALRIRSPARRPARRPATRSAPPEAGAATASRGGGLPAFVPPEFRAPLAARRPRAGTSPAALLAAQLMAESNFNPYAVSPAGAQGIAQFMPAPRPPTASATRSTRPPRSTPRRT